LFVRYVRFDRFRFDRRAASHLVRLLQRVTVRVPGIGEGGPERMCFSPRRRFRALRRETRGPARRRRRRPRRSPLLRRRGGRPRHGHGPLSRGRRRGVLGVARAIRDELALSGELGQEVALILRQAQPTRAGTPLRASANHRGGRVGAGAGRVRRRLLAGRGVVPGRRECATVRAKDETCGACAATSRAPSGRLASTGATISRNAEG
jgi:hypothetical protein